MEDKKKTVFIIMLILLAIIIISGIIWAIRYAMAPEYKKFYDETYKTCIAERNSPYFMLLALKTGDESYCKKLDNSKGCIARLRKDASYCDIPEASSEEKQRCRALVLKDRSLCLPEAYYCLAYTTGDASYCNKLEDKEGSVADCIADSTLNAEHYLDPKIDQECKDQAYSFAAISIRDARLCGNILDPELKQNCASIAR